MTISFGFSLFSHNHVNQTVTVLSIVGWLRWTTLCKSCSSQTRDTKVHNMQLCVASFSFIMENDQNPLSEISTNLPNSRGAQILSRSKRRQEEAAKHEQCRRFVNSIQGASSSSATGSGSERKCDQSYEIKHIFLRFFQRKIGCVHSS